jgi:molecular chaperone HscB
MIDFSRNHFELFGLPARYSVDAAALERAYRALQTDVHPDRHAAGSDAQKRAASQASARVNEAYRTLRDPVERAEYLLQLQGVDTGASARLPVAFLTQQLERREAAEDATAAHDDATLARLLRDVRADAAELQDDVESALAAPNLAVAAARARELRFLTRLAEDLETLHADKVDT